MRRTARLVGLAALIGAATLHTGPGFAFDVQSGGVPLSAQHVALLANRLAAQSKDIQSKANIPGTGTAGAVTKSPTRDERMMEFMLGGKPATREAAATGGVAELKALLRNRR